MSPSSPLFPYTTLFRSIAFIIASQAFNCRRLIAKSFQKGIGKFSRIKWLFNKKRYSFFNLNSFHRLIPHVFFLIVLRSEEHTSELQSSGHLVCRLLLDK